MPDARTKPPLLRVFSHRNFALFIGSILPNYMTGWIMRVGAGWLAWELTHSTTWLGVIAAADLAPMLVIAPFAGAISDRMEPLKLIRIAQALLFLHVVALTALTWTGLITIEVLFLLAVFAGCVYPFHSAARQSIIPSTVSREDFSSAVAVDSAFYHSNRFVGPAVAAIIIPIWGVTGAFLAHCLGAGLSVIGFAILRLPPTDRTGRARASLFSEIGETFTYAWRHDAIRPALLILLFASVLVRPLQDMLPGFADVVFKGDATTLAWLTSAMGAGALIGAVHIAMRGGTSGLVFSAIAGFAATGVSTFLFAATSNFWLGLLFAAIAGYALSITAVCIQALMQLAVEDRLRGRVLSLYLLCYRGTPAIGALAVGVAAEALGLQLTFMIASALCIATLVFILPGYRATVAALDAHPKKM